MQQRILRASRLYRRELSGLLLLAPAILILVVFRFVPLIAAFQTSLYHVNVLSGTRTFAGLDNYGRALGDPIFLKSLVNTTVYALAKVPIEVTVAFGLALLVNQGIRGIIVVRTAAFLPVITSLVVAATMWLLLLDPNQGLIDGFLGTLRLPPQPFLHAAGQALFTLVGVMVWKDVGLSMLFFLAGLQGIPQEYYEAATVDGAGALQRLRFVTIPLLRGTLLFVLVIEMTFAFRVFEPVYIMTQGGPLQATSVVVFDIYEQAFPFNSLGYATALSVILLVVILAVTLILRRVTGETVSY